MAGEVTLSPVEIARKVLEGVEYFGAETILARAVIELSAENASQGRALREIAERLGVERAVRNIALAALSPTEGDGRKEQT